jgi:RNA polymerase sigma-70 factor (ECF subfamily)
MAKVISINQSEFELIAWCLDNNRQAQKILYDKYSSKMLSVCRRYIKDLHFAEDIMVTAFIKAFKNLQKFENKGSFEGWLRRIMVNESLSYLRSQKDNYSYDFPISEAHEDAIADMNLDMERWQSLIDELPNGCKMVFNLFVFDEFKHHEIADKLNISVNTSKSQLAHAKKILQFKINQVNAFGHEKFTK